MELSDAIGKLSALAHPGRLAAFRLLVQAGPSGLAAGAIARALDMPPSTLTANMNLLSQAGLAQSRRDGRSILYSAQFAAMTALLGYLMEDCCGGATEICAPLQEIAMASACCPDTPTAS